MFMKIWATSRGRRIHAILCVREAVKIKIGALKLNVGGEDESKKMRMLESGWL